MTAPLDDDSLARVSDLPNAPAPPLTVASVVDLNEPPPRPVWATIAPTAPWCPAEWDAVLARVVPSWATRESRSAPSGRDVPDAIGVEQRDAAWALVGAARRGRLHAHRGEFREDAIDARGFDLGWCGAVGDGAGSAAWSRIGSTVATHTFCTVAAATIGPAEERARTASRAVFETLRALAAALEIAPRLLRTTLLAVVYTADHIACVQVGDGGIALIRTDGTVLSPQSGDAGEFSGDVTLFLPDDGSDARMISSVQSLAAESIRGVLLATDGIEDPFYPLHRHAGAVAQMIEHGVDDVLASEVAAASSVRVEFRGPVLDASDRVRALLEWMAFEKRGENDDRALLYARSLSGR